MSEEDDGVVRIITNRVADAQIKDVMQGSTIEKCDDCGEAIWISPTTKSARAAMPATKIVETLCIKCFKPHPAFEQPVMISPGQIEEIEKHIGRKLMQADIDVALIRLKMLCALKAAIPCRGCGKVPCDGEGCGGEE